MARYPDTLISYHGNKTTLFYDDSPDSISAAKLAEKINYERPGEIVIIGGASGPHRMPRLDTREARYFGPDVLGVLNRWS